MDFKSCPAVCLEVMLPSQHAGSGKGNPLHILNRRAVACLGEPIHSGCATKDFWLHAYNLHCIAGDACSNHGPLAHKITLPPRNVCMLTGTAVLHCLHAPHAIFLALCTQPQISVEPQGQPVSKGETVQGQWIEAMPGTLGYDLRETLTKQQLCCSLLGLLQQLMHTDAHVGHR